MICLLSQTLFSFVEGSLWGLQKHENNSMGLSHASHFSPYFPLLSDAVKSSLASEIVREVDGTIL